MIDPEIGVMAAVGILAFSTLMLASAAYNHARHIERLNGRLRELEELAAAAIEAGAGLVGQLKAEIEEREGGR